MTHALRQHCGSFLYSNIRREWIPTEEGETKAQASPTASKDPIPLKEATRMSSTSLTGRSASGSFSGSSEYCIIHTDEEVEEEGEQQRLKEWPLFDSPAITSIRVPGFQDKNGTVYFSVMVTLEGFQWTVDKTFDDFATLHKVLVHEYGVEKNLLPTKRLFGYFGLPKNEYLVDLQGRFETFLGTILQQFQIPPTELLKFLEYPFTDILSVTQALARFFYEEGEKALASDKAVQMSPLQLHCVNRRLTLPLASSGSGTMKDDFGNLLDFLQHLRKLKVSPPSNENYAISRTEHLTFDLSIMRGLQVLYLESVEMAQLHSKAVLPAQVTALEVRRSIKGLKDILVVYPPLELDQPPQQAHVPTQDLSRALQWTHLSHASFKLNTLKRIDDSLKLLPCLEKLDLSFNCIEEIENLVELPHLRVVDLSHNKISSLQALHTKIGNVSKIGLASNRIKSTDGMQKALSLEYVDLANNIISEVSEVRHLSPLPCLIELHLQGNPIAHSPSYRANVFAQLHTIAEQVALDGKKAMKDEMEVSAQLLTPTGRKPSRMADIKPDMDETDSKEAQGELDASLSVTSRLEELRKEGGERWLTIFNAERAKKQGTREEDDDELVLRSPKKKKARRHRHHRTHRKGHRKEGQKEGSMDRETSLPPEEEVEEEVEVEEGLSQNLMELIEAKHREKIQATSNFAVTVLEYPGSLQTLSPSDVDQLLLNHPLEECAVSVDGSQRRVLEVIVAASKTRCQWDLGLLQDMRIHEGRRMAMCLQFSMFNSTPLWVVYCVKDMETLALLYVTLQHVIEDSRTGTPSDPLSISEVANSLITSGQLQNAMEETDNYLPEQHDQLDKTTPTTNSGGATPAESASPVHTPLRSQSPVHSTESPSLSRGQSTTPPSSRTPPDPMTSSLKPRSTGSTPTGSRSPARPGSPVRSKTPEPSLLSSLTSSVKLAPAIPSTASATADDLKPELAPPTQVNRPLTPTKLTGTQEGKKTPGARKVVKKPPLGQSLMTFFQNSIAREPSEVLLNVLWGGCNIPSCTDCEIEGGMLVSDRGVYLVEVIDPDKQRQLSWTGENLPLVVVFHSSLLTLQRIRVGIFDQSVVIEFVEKGAIKSFAYFPHSYEDMQNLTANLKAALDASDMGHQVTSTQEAILNPPEPNLVLFLNPDSSDLQKLKESMVQGKTVTQVSNFIATSKTQEVDFSVEAEVRRIMEDLSAKFDIVQYVIVSEVSSDLLPISNGKAHLRSRALVLTNNMLYLCKQEILSWPREETSPIKPPFSRCCVLDSHRVADVVDAKMCDKAQPVTSCSNPVYEFTISFEASENSSSTKGHTEWKLCVHDRQYIDQFFACLSQLWQDVQQGQLPVVHTAEPLSVIAVEDQTARKTLSMNGLKEKSPAFFQSEVLVEFCSLPNYERLKFFKDHIAQAEFMNSDETPLAMFLARCSASLQGYAEIEACVVASNYALYLLSDVENIQRWLDRGGPSSYLRMSLLSRKDASKARCFYRLWLNEIKEVRAGLFYLSVEIMETKGDVRFAIHTQNASATLCFLSALSSTLNLKNSAEEEVLSELLSDYIDLSCDSFSEKARRTRKSARPHVEFSQPSADDVDNLKQMLLEVGPSVTTSSITGKCSNSLQILCQQVMLLVEEMRVRDTMAVQFHPHLVLLTNYGLYICANMHVDHNSPSVFSAAELKVKKWCHIDLVDHIETMCSPSTSCQSHDIIIHLRSQQAAGMEMGTLHLVAQNSELMDYFLHFFSLLWHERSGKQLPVHRN